MYFLNLGVNGLKIGETRLAGSCAVHSMFRVEPFSSQFETKFTRPKTIGDLRIVFGETPIRSVVRQQCQSEGVGDSERGGRPAEHGREARRPDHCQRSARLVRDS